MHVSKLAYDSFWRSGVTLPVSHCHPSRIHPSRIRLDEGPSLPRIITPDGQVVPREEEHQQNGNQEAVQQEPKDLEAYNREIEHQEVLREDTPQEVEQQEDVQQEDVQQEDVEPEYVQVEDVQWETLQERDLQTNDTNKEPSMIQLKKVMKSLWNPQTKHSSRGHSWMIAHRERLRLAFGYFETDSRNDLTTLVPPQLYHLQIRPEDEEQIPTQGVAVVTDFRKQYADRLRYSIFLREEDVQVCPIGALAFFLLGKWTVCDKSLALLLLLLVLMYLAANLHNGR